MKLQYKLFTAFLITSLLIVVLMAGIMHVSVRKNFVRYAHETALDRLENVFTYLEAHYRNHRSWDLLKHPENWAAVLEYARPAKHFDQGFLPGKPGRPLKDHGRHPSGGFRPDPRLTGFPPADGPRHPAGPGGFDKEGLRGNPTENRLGRLHTRLCLFDPDKNPVTGEFAMDAEYVFREISLDGTIVGWLGLRLPPRPETPLELAFLKKQVNAFCYIAVGILAIALVISYLLSRMLLAPVHELMRGTRALKSFDFSVKIEPRSHDELGLLARDFNQMARTIRQYETLRKNWISDISHELRTPIAVLQSKLEALQDGIRKATPDMLDSLNRDIKGLGKLVENLHLMSLADSKSLAMVKKPVDVPALLTRTLEGFQVRLEQKDIRLSKTKFPDACRVFADPHHLGRVFVNLVENTLRYTDSPGQLTVNAARTGRRLILQLEDSPPGVPKDSLEAIFDRLFRVDKSRSRALGGSGLGLSICRQVVEAHDGRIFAGHSDLGGLKITLELPLLPK